MCFCCCIGSGSSFYRIVFGILIEKYFCLKIIIIIISSSINIISYLYIVKYIIIKRIHDYIFGTHAMFSAPLRSWSISNARFCSLDTLKFSITSHRPSTPLGWWWWWWTTIMAHSLASLLLWLIERYTSEGKDCSWAWRTKCALMHCVYLRRLEPWQSVMVALW